MKLKILLLVGMGLAGLGASYALADAGHGRGEGKAKHAATTGACVRTHLHGTVTAPQMLTVTVSKAGKASSLAPNQVVTVSLGSSGQSVRVNVEGCWDGSSLTANQAVLHVMRGMHGDDEHGTTTTDAGTTTGETTTDSSGG
jgi:hypothetical protein